MSRVVYTSAYVPEEWIAAHGLEPSRAFPGPPRADCRLPVAEGMCPFARAFGAAAADSGGARAVVFDTACDQMRRMAAVVRPETRTPLFLLNVPATWQTPAAEQLYADELRRLGRFLVRVGGQAPSMARLADTMRRYDAERSERRAWRASPAPPGRDTVPLALLGGPVPPTPPSFLEVVAQAGARVVLDGTDSGERTWPRPFDPRRLQDDPFGELAASYLAVPGIFQRPNRPFHAWLARELDARGARGVIVRNYVWCDLWRAEASRIAESCGRPVLHLDVEAAGAASNLATRVRAFVETLAAQRARP